MKSLIVIGKSDKAIMRLIEEAMEHTREMKVKARWELQPYVR